MIAYLRSLANRLLKTKQAEFENSSLQDLAKLEYVTQVGPAHQRIHNSWDPGIDITDHFFKMLVNFNPNLPTIPVEHEMAILGRTGKVWRPNFVTVSRRMGVSG